MKQIIPTFNYQLYKYLLVLSPSKEVGQHIWSVKNEFYGKEGAQLATATAPHLTLISFAALPEWEEKIVNRLQLIGMGITPFNVELKDFIVYETSRTICINVVSKYAVLYLVQELKQAKPLLHLNKSFPPYFINDPHVSICRNITPELFQVASVKYSTRQFSGNFTVSSMTLLKRPFGELECSTVGQFMFQSSPQLPMQGNLFM
jgi:2'-5' RNA ligase